MAGIGVLQPNELVLYNAEGEPYFARYSYSFKGLWTTSDSPSAGEIIEKARDEDITGTPLPAQDAPLFGNSLPQTRVVVRRYSEQTGQARIIVEWGVRFGGSGGATAPLVQRSSSVVTTGFNQPYTIFSSGGAFPNLTLSVSYGEREVPRIRTRVRMRNLITIADEDEALEVDQAIENNINKLFNYNGVQRILTGGGYSPFSANQGYVTTVWDRYSPVLEVLEGALIDNTNTATGITTKNLAVQPLGANQVYLPPDPVAGTRAQLITETYEQGNLADLYWL
jgi:hypothetical protein